MKKFIVIALILIAAAIVGGRWFALEYLQTPFVSRTTFSEPLMLRVQRGDSARHIIAQINGHLKRDSDRIDYRLSQLLIGIDRLQAGVYQVSPTDSWQTLWQKLERGDEMQFSVTLVEGLRIEQWLKHLQAQPFLKATLRPDNLIEQLDFIDGYTNAEGLFLPETYHYRADKTDKDILRRAYQAMQQKLDEIWQQRSADCPVDTPYELLILASIIEKETGIDGERAMVASVFANRMAIGMRLQSDPTTIYGIEAFDGNLTRAHLREKTAYNTYRIDGLPPTPIAMVSEASLRAAADPAQSDYFYFVANGEGGHVFSKTLEEHNKAVRKYQLNTATDDSQGEQ